MAVATGPVDRAAGDPARVAAAALTSVVLWSSAFVGIRFAGRELSPGPLALARLLVGSLVLGAVMRRRGDALPSRRALPGAAACGLLWFGLYTVALNAAERRIDAGTASILVNTAPIFIAVLAGAVLREGFPRGLLAGCLVSFAGVAVIGLGVSRHGLHASCGVALCVIAALAYAAGVVAQKPALRHGAALPITWAACTVAAAACLPYAPELVRELGHARAGTIAWTLYLGLGPTAVGFATWAYALARTDARRLGAATYLVPPLAVLLGWLLLAERPPLLALPGGLLCLAGVALTRLGSGASAGDRPSGRSWPTSSRATTPRTPCAAPARAPTARRRPG
jgi:drug/metabolite transporter (DMT)-like permease